MSETTIPHLDYDKALSLLNAAREEKGENYVYPGLPGADRALPWESCAYVHGMTWEDDPESIDYAKRANFDNAEPGCLIGNALHRFGVPFDQLTNKGAANTGVPASELLYSLQRRGILTFDSKAAQLFRYAQDKQDQSKPWGEAISAAVDLINRVDNDE